MTSDSSESETPSTAPPVLTPLCKIPAGTRVVIQELAGGRSFQQWATGMGLTAGRAVEVLRGGGSSGPVMVAVGEARLAIGHGMAQKILVDTQP
ncbi:MAG: ferrous iron transport protein A [bacterium]|nr:ferrous iron transport protein A [bacterium]